MLRNYSRLAGTMTEDMYASGYFPEEVAAGAASSEAGLSDAHSRHISGCGFTHGGPGSQNLSPLCPLWEGATFPR